MRNQKLLTAFTALTLVASQHTLAAEDNDQNAENDQANKGQVIVTTRKREENLLDVPISLTVFTSEDIQDGGISDVADLANLTPGFTIAPLFGGGASTPVIRGLSTTIGEPNVGFFIDGVYQSSRALMEAMLGNNIERIEIAKGPQSALYGRNTFGGAINFVTKRPTSDPEGELKIGLGDFGSQDFRFMHSGPIGGVNYRLWANHISRDGYYKNELTGGDLDDRETNTIGVQLQGGDEVFNFALTINKQDINDGGEALKQIENNGRFASFRGVFPPDFQLYVGEVPSITSGYAVTPGHDEKDNLATSLRLDWSLDGMTLTSITGFNDFSGDQFADDDYDPREIHSATTLTEQTELSQEVRLQSDNEEGDEWTVGFYTYDLALETDLTAGYLGFLAGIFGASNNLTEESTASTAFFGSYNWHLTEQMNLIFSGRYFKETKKATVASTNLISGAVGTFDDAETFYDFTPRIDLEYHLDAGGMIYGSAAKAVKAGGFNVVTISGAILDEERTYDSESSMNYEIGYKNTYMDNRLNLTAALFFINWEDQIVRALGATNAVLNVNAGETSSNGFELEINARPTDYLTIRAGLAYTDATYDKYTFGALAGLGINPVIDGTQLQYVSEWQSNISFQYRGGQAWDDFNWFGRFDASYQSEQSITQNADAKVPERTIANLRFGVENTDWRIYLWANNLLDDDASISGVFAPAPAAQADVFVFGLRTGFPVFQGIINAPIPRTFGITAFYNF